MSSDTYPHPAAVDPAQLLRRCELTRGKASGPGGQHRNKVETAVQIRHTPSDITGFAAERRSQADNRRMAMFRLRVNLAVEYRIDPPRGAIPSTLWQSRCVKGKIAVNRSHEDYPAMLAEAMDAIWRDAGDVKHTAVILGCSTTQLVRFIKGEPQAWEKLNTLRKQKGMSPLK